MTLAAPASDGGQAAVLSSRDAQHMRVKLLSEGKVICERCHRVGPAKQSLTVVYRGNPLTSVCPACLPEQSVLISRNATHIQVRLVDPDRVREGAIQLATPSERAVLENGIGPFGPTVEKKDLG